MVLNSWCPDGQGLLTTDCQAADSVWGSSSALWWRHLCEGPFIWSPIVNGVAPYSRICMMVATHTRAPLLGAWRLVRAVGLLCTMHFGGASGDRSRRCASTGKGAHGAGSCGSSGSAPCTSNRHSGPGGRSDGCPGGAAAAPTRV